MESSDINETGNRSGEVEESDSGDSIFFTQKPQTSKSNAATSSLCSLRSKPLSPRFLESGSSSEDEDVPEKGRGHSRLPKYNFTIINRRKTPLLEDESGRVGRNRAIHHRGVAGFFRCFKEMWSSDQTNESFESTLPTVDADNEEITPITEDEKSDEEEVKIIDKRQFVYLLKPKTTKSSQPWFKKAKTSKPTRQLISHFGTKKTALATSNTPEALSNDKHLKNSDATLIEVYESISPSQVNLLSELDTQSQSILQNHPLDIRGRHCDSTNDTIANQADKKLENENVNVPFSQESVDLFEDYITKYPSPHRRKDKTSRKTCHSNNLITKSNGDTAGLETTPMTKLNPPSCNPKKDIRGQSQNEELLSCVNAEDDCDGAEQKNRKKKSKKNKADNKRNGTYLDSLQILDAGQCENIPVVKRKHKKNQKVVVESQDDCELVNNDNSATDCVTVQRDESVSVRKKKKKRQVPFVAETVENVALHFSLSGEDQVHGISTNDIESAEMNRLLRKTELGNKEVNNTNRKENVEIDNTGPNAMITESENCDNTEVTQPPRDESDQMKKKKKKKTSQSVAKTTPEGVKDSAILSPNGSECSARKNKDQKKKRQFCEGEVEDRAVNKKKKKKRSFKDDDQTVSSSSHVEMSPSSGRLEKSSRPKVKKRLYIPNETLMDSF